MPNGPEWPTLALVVADFAAWAAVTIFADRIGLWFAIPVLAIVLTLHSSLQHEALHGHPFRNRRLSEALVYAPIGLFVPYPRFRDLHISHHRDSILTDPYDDPEANYLDPEVWERQWAPMRALLTFNNTLLGRLIVGPAIGIGWFLLRELRAARAGDAQVREAWARHAVALVLVVCWIALVGSMPGWAYLAGAYLAMSILKIRTFAEHQAHERALGRSVIIEDRGPLAFLFLNNNLHAVHHAYPQVPWYRLPAFYRARRAEWLERNLGYRFDSYGQLLRLHLLRPKDPVAHPLWPRT